MEAPPVPQIRIRCMKIYPRTLRFMSGIDGFRKGIVMEKRRTPCKMENH